MREDYFTSTVEGAAAHAMQFAVPVDPPEVPSAEDLARDERERARDRRIQETE